MLLRFLRFLEPLSTTILHYIYYAALLYRTVDKKMHLLKVLSIVLNVSFSSLSEQCSCDRSSFTELDAIFLFHV